MTKSYKELNLEFYDALNQIFNLKKHSTWDSLKAEITIPKIKETYRTYAQIFPLDLDRYSILPKNNPKEKLTSIFHGSLNGKTIINNVARYSLYNDELIVFHPIQNPNIGNEKLNPIINTEQWRYEFVNNLYFYIVMQRWVKSGIVHLIENPFYFSMDWKIFTDEAEKRVNTYKKGQFDGEIMQEIETEQREKMMDSLLGSSLEIVKKTIKKTYPNYSDEAAEKLARELKQYHAGFPLYVNFDNCSNVGSLSINKTGANIEMIDALCRITGAHSYTTQKFIKKQIELRGTNDHWTKFSILYSGLNLTYLDNVDTSFALNLREEDRLSGLRTELRKLSSFLDSNDLSNVTDDTILEFNENFKQSVSESEVEWQKIFDDSRKRNMGLIGMPSLISLIINPTQFIVPMASIPISMAITEFFKRKNLSNYRQKDGFSVFVDLKNQKPNFFSNLRNCLL